MRTVAIIQARMSSTRLPGKVMMPLAGRPVLKHVVGRVSQASTVDETVVATTTESPDDVIVRVANESGNPAFRGSESDVLDRMHKTAVIHDAERIVRICADSPLVSGRIIDMAVERHWTNDYDYVSNKIERSFPIGLDVEVFSKESFDVVEKKSKEPHEREHVTVYYQESVDEFELGRLPATAVFSDPQLCGRTDLRFTLDEPADYFLLKKVFENASDGLTSPADAIRYVDRQGLTELNSDVRQKSMYETE